MPRRLRVEFPGVIYHARRLQMGTRKSAAMKLFRWDKDGVQAKLAQDKALV